MLKNILILFIFINSIYLLPNYASKDKIGDDFERLRQSISKVEKGYEADDECEAVKSLRYTRSSKAKNNIKAIRRASKQGNTEAQYDFGVCYAYGIGIAKSKSKAIYWLKKAAEQKHKNAQFELYDQMGCLSFDKDNYNQRVETE